MTESASARLNAYLSKHHITVVQPLGQGKDGTVFVTDRVTAVKVHERPESYLPERNAYIRLLDLKVDRISGFAVPVLELYDDDLRVIEMTIVMAPYILDFASAKIDAAHDLIEDEGHTLIDMIRERFDERADDVIALIDELGSYAGVYLTDVHAHNIKFAPPG
jgi:hypothetical protein